MVSYTKHNIENLTDFENLVMDMAKAESRPIHVKGMPHVDYNPMMLGMDMPDDFWYPDSIAIVNKKSQAVAQIAGANYKILQHPDYFSMVTDMLRRNNFKDVHGYALEGNNGDFWTARLIFDSIEVEEPGMGRNIKVGAEFSNSYDSVYAARGRAYYLRVSCTNQMILGNVIPEAIFSKSHMAPSEHELLETVTIKCEDFFTNLLDSGISLKNVIEDAIDDDVLFTNEHQLQTALTDIFKVQTHARAITELAMKDARQVGSKQVLDRWQIYNAVTEYASHNPITPNVMDNLMYRGENKILNKPIEIPAVA